MYNEIDASNIIATLVSGDNKVENKKNNEFVIPYTNIRKIAEHLEDTIPTLLATYDMMSIDAFRCSFINHVKMETDRLVIRNIQEIYTQLEKLRPSEAVSKKIIRISAKHHPK